MASDQPIQGELKLVGISLTSKYILLEDDRTLPVVKMMDGRGDYTEDPTKALGVIYELPDGKFGVLHLAILDDDHYIKES